ncbi:hypothetical protein CHH58_13385 [Terribacillus saccharophilus]|uniref:DUF2705 family protein n=1 Tax=Terribacillus saccharophilus TaxID=361277 RepID=UPI000BA687EF|nr:DUF2705 family protein [Terribacillus saccharophilus]PAF36238.1 hypothetical protein CHH58_13385 [Terribacillus saccharophilus]
MLSDFFRIINNKKSMILIWVIILVPLVDLSQLLLVKLNLGEDYHPAFAFFLAGSSQGHISQILLLWFLPVYFLIICTDNYIEDLKYGYNHILISKMGKNKYIRNKLVFSFITPFITMFLALLINLLFSYILFWGGTSSLGIFEMDIEGNTLWELSVQFPLLTNLSYLLLACFLTGLSGLLGASASLIFPDRRYAYPITFFIWFSLVLWEDSIMNLFQPFTEFDFDYLLPTLIRDLVILLIIPLIVYLYKVKTDEI